MPEVYKKRIRRMKLIDADELKRLIDLKGDRLKPIIYLSGPITNDPGYKAKFQTVQDDLELKGYVVLNPANEVKVHPDKEWSDYMAEAIALMLKADKVYMLPGWEKSTGASLEMKLARQLGKGVCFA